MAVGRSMSTRGGWGMNFLQKSPLNLTKWSFAWYNLGLLPCQIARPSRNARVSKSTAPTIRWLQRTEASSFCARLHPGR